MFVVFSSRALAQAPPGLPPQGPPVTPGTTRADLIRQRQEWFYQQRAYPLPRIPARVRLTALEQLDRLLANEAALPSPLAPSTSQWTQIGPQPTNTPFAYPLSAGRVTALAVDPTNSSAVYLGAAQGGVWKSTNGGTSWTVLTDAQVSLAVGSIALDPSNSSIVYVGTGEENFSGDSYYGAGILKSTDGGSTWTQLGASTFGGPKGGSTGGAMIGAVAVHPTNGQIVLAAGYSYINSTYAGIFRSADGGSTWTNVLSNTPGTAVVFDPTNGNIAYAATGNVFNYGPSTSTVYRSTDAGLTWNRADNGSLNPLPTTGVGRIALALAPSSTTTLFASLANISTGGLMGLYKSTDSGVNWAKLTIGDYCTAQCWYDNVIAVSPVNANVVFVAGSATGNGTLLRSTDGGATWGNVSSGTNGVSLHVDHHALAFSSDGTKLWVGNDGGSWSTTDVTNGSVSWTNLNSTLAITQFYGGFSVHPTDANTAFGGSQDNGTQKYSGSLTWNYATCGDGGWTALNPATPTTVYASCQNIQILKSTTGGAYGSWSSAQSGIAGDRVQFIPPFVLDPSTPANLYFGTYRVYQTTNSAGSWAAISGDLTSTGSDALTTIAVAPSDSNTVYVGTTNSKVQVTTNALAGASAIWTDRSSASLPGRVVTQITVDPANSLIAYVTFSGFTYGGDTKGHIFKTINGGSTWTDISGNLPNTPVNDIVVDPDVAGTLYAGTDIGVFRTTDGGSTWSTLMTGLPRVAVLGLKLQRATRTLVAATHGRSVWNLSVPAKKRRGQTVSD